LLRDDACYSVTTIGCPHVIPSQSPRLHRILDERQPQPPLPLLRRPEEGQQRPRRRFGRVQLFAHVPRSLNADAGAPSSNWIASAMIWPAPPALGVPLANTSTATVPVLLEGTANVTL
jgi:hypothetical protein